MVAEVLPSQALLLYTNHQFRSGFVKLLLSSTASLGAVRSSEPTRDLLLEVCPFSQKRPDPPSPLRRRGGRGGEGEGEKVPVRAPLNSSWLSKRQQLIAGVGGVERPEIGTYTVLPENKIITTGSALEMQIPRLHSTPGIPGARGGSRRNPVSSQSSPTRRVFGSRGCLGALRVAQGLQASPGTPLTLHPTTVLTPLPPQTLAPLQSKSRHPHWSPGPPALLRPQPDTPAPAPASLTPSAVSTASSKPQESS